MRIDDIVHLESIYCFDIKKSKTVAGVRSIPIHSTLEKLGLHKFIEYKEKIGSEFLFDDLKEYKSKNGRIVERGNSVGKWFNIKNAKETRKGHLNLVGITDRGKKIHSFRHTFINHLKQRKVPVEIVKELVGHDTDDITYDNYAQPYNKRILKDTIEIINYRGVDLPWLVNKHYHKINFPWDKQ